ncbi:unnamed protein product [Paramecium primaurelia]|uniref:Kinesin-like protein n=1 Tax=Paramecium primaurelia TaxID=5886 RepID=A0A8S1N1I0_PARPR|nr:unnamed protein product [Paramecium primaurelia]CAD8119887.1 unnamed protein product [Paramecium primaurelia]
MNEAIKIFVRMRPPLQNEDEEAWKIQKESNTIISLPRDPQTTRRYADAFYNYQFTFDKIFSNEDKNEDIYKHCKQLLNYTLQGFNSSLFLYGQTTSGKTYTMLGDQENPGLLPYTLLDLFKECQLPIAISYIEIYNEQINDLLQQGATNLKMQDINGQAFVNQLRIQQVENFDDALSLLCDGEEQRMYRERQIHEHSSRSHTIFQILVQHESHTSTLSLIDLAGSERLNEEDASDETAYINKSLFVLSNVINKLAEGKKSHIPYRDSKLTRYLQNSLGGNSYTTIICTLSPASMNFYQTLSTLRFAQRAKKVENKIYKQESLSKSGLIEALQKELNDIKVERDQLKIQLQQQQSNNNFDQIIDVFIQYIALQVHDKQKFIEDTNILKDVYNQQHKQLIQSLYNQIMQICQDCNLPKGLNNPMSNQTQKVFVQQFKELINKQLQEESIFNNVYVQSILNPQSDFQSYQTQQLMPILESAFQEAMNALQNKLNEITSVVQNIGELSYQNQKIFDDKSLKKYFEIVNNEYNWMKQCKLQLNEQFNKKTQVLQQAFNNVSKNLNDSRLNSQNNNNKQQQQQLQNITNIINPNIRQSTNTPKFTERDKTALFVWGSGKDGRLGTGSLASQPIPYKVQIQNLQYISCGYYHSAAINIEQQLFIWGKNYDLTPQKQPQFNNIIQVACGCQHTLILDSLGQVFSWGIGDEGQLGNESYFNSDEPVKILDNIIYIEASRSHSAAINKDNLFYSWGSNIDYRLGLEEKKNYNIPTSTGIQVNKISLGTNHSAFIRQDGIVFTTGNGQQGQLGNKINSECYLNLQLDIKAVDVICGEDITLFINNNGDVFSCGKKSNGNLGHLMSSIPAFLQQPKQIEGLQKIKQISVGKRHCLAISSNKQVWGWGFNFFDQLGLGDKNRFIEQPIKLDLQDVIQVSCGEYHSLALCQN